MLFGLKKGANANEPSAIAESKARKARSIALLKEQQIPYIDHLPVLEASTSDIIKVRTDWEIAQRAVCSIVTIQVAFDRIHEDDVENSTVFFGRILRAYEVKDDLTELEGKVFAGLLEREDLIRFTWQYEAAWTLLWALGLVGELDFPSHICDYQQAIQPIATCKTMGDLLALTHLRPIEEILDAADLTYRYHWACVDARMHDQEPPMGLNEDVVVERHKGLNWLIGYSDDWDNTPADT
ncbi:MAG: DUF4272 domain-containing protein [Anaerotruncus sp.]|jgi:hypothetical protein|nr:DUF4272 domain-containing protein [Anaerotruncus sp.]